MTYNIHHGEGLDGKINLERIADVIKNENPDLVALQEVDFKTKRSRGVDQAARLGELCEMQSIFGRAIDYKGGQFGNCILSKSPFVSSKNYPLPKAGAENRSMVTATIRINRRKTLTFASAHFDHKNIDSRAQASAYIAKLVATTDLLVVLAGDLNCLPDADELHPLATVLRSVNKDPIATFPARSPKSQIDYILYDKRARWKIKEVRAIDDKGASDHLPLLAIVKINR